MVCTMFVFEGDGIKILFKHKHVAIDRKCDDALHREELSVAVVLRPEMQSGSFLVNWIENRRREFGERGKMFSVITDDSLQIESLELIHPDSEITYYTSIRNFETSFKQVPASLSLQPAESKPVFSVSGNTRPIEEKPKQIVVSIGDTIGISGEYTCLSCGVSRMWLKGKMVSACENQECFESNKWWQLEYDLF